jgi:hypothetical protein
VSKLYKYLVEFKVDVKRTDNQMLTDEENAMVLEVQKATEKAIAEIMAKHGQGSKRLLGRTMETY